MSVLHRGGGGKRAGGGHCMHRYDSTCCVYTGSDIIPAHAHDPPPLPPRRRMLIFPLLIP